jgi:two-component system sensor histidine kinase KdpD
MDDRRPDPDRLLARVAAEEVRARRGKLKVFLGAAPGVGKTYAMLGAARELRKQGVDLVVGLVETHGRQETEAMLEGLDVLPRRRIEYRGRTLEELDLDALLRRRPAVALVDELAHHNVPGSRHERRYQDLEELLDAGIDVFTAVNVQHLESLNDVVARITGVHVRETVPDAFLDRLSDIVLIDLPPRELIERLRQGKVYVPDRAQAALDRFFSRRNLAALRELAMQTAADRIDADLRDDLAADDAPAAPAVRRRVLVAVDGHAHTESMVRIARRFAERQQAPWTVAHVETGRRARADDARLQAAFQLAERLGGETVILRGASVAEELLSHATRHGVSSILLGRTRERPLARALGRTITQQLLTRGARFEITIVSTPVARLRARRLQLGDLRWAALLGAYAEATAATAAAILLSAALERWLPLASLAMVFLCAVLVVAVRSRTGVALYAALLSFAAYNFFFTEPRMTFRIASFADVAAVFAFLGAALVCGQLAARQHEQVVMLRVANDHARVLQSLGERLAAAVDEAQVFQCTCEALAAALGCGAVVLRRDGDVGALRRACAWPVDAQLTANDMTAADWTTAHAQPAGRHTTTLSASPWWFVPLVVEGDRLGAMGLRFPASQTLLTQEQRQLAEAIVQQAALAADRTRLVANLESARVEGETERLRTALLSSVSHDLRAPLASMIGAAARLADVDEPSAARRGELLAVIRRDGERLDRYIQNLLDMTRLGSGPMPLERDWVHLREILGAALARLRRAYPALEVTTELDAALPPLWVHPALIEQALFNILENAARFSPPGAAVRVHARRDADTRLILVIADRGPGIPEDERRRIFEGFEGARHDDSAPRITGLGLTIVRGLLGAHGGRVEALVGDGGVGTAIRVTLPLSAPPTAQAG